MRIIKGKLKIPLKIKVKLLRRVKIRAIRLKNKLMGKRYKEVGPKLRKLLSENLCKKMIRL